MNKVSGYFISLLFCIISSISFAQELPLSSNALKEDFKIFRGALEEMHPGLYWYSSKKEMDETFEKIESSLNEEMTELDFYRLLSMAISEIRCGHTWIAPSETLAKKLFEERPFLPIEIKLIDGKAYFFKNYSAQKLDIKLGQQILKVNGISIDSLVELSNKVNSGDGWITTGKSKILERFFNWFYVIQISQPKVYEITYLDENNQSRNVEVKAILSSEFNTEKAGKIKRNIETSILENSTSLLTIGEFDNWREQGEKKKFLKELRKAFIEIDSAKIKNLIIDIRNNGGGIEKYGLTLCSYFASEPFHGYKQIRFKNTKFKYRKYSKTSGVEYFIYRALLNHKKVNDTTYLLKNDNNLKLIKPSKPHFSGNIYILMNGGTYSTAADFSALMHSKGLATFVGEETGGGYRGNSSDYEFEFVLPNSKIRFNAPLAQYVTNVNYTADSYGRGILPDYKAQPTIKNLINGIDTELNYTLKLIERE